MLLNYMYLLAKSVGDIEFGMVSSEFYNFLFPV